MILVFVLVLAGCLYILLMHVLSSRVPRSRDAFGQVPAVYTIASGPDRTLAQVDRAQIERTGAGGAAGAAGAACPLRPALDDAGELTIAGYRFQRTGPGEYRYRGWAAEAVLTVKPIPGSRLVEVGYAVDAKW